MICLQFSRWGANVHFFYQIKLNYQQTCPTMLQCTANFEASEQVASGQKWCKTKFKSTKLKKTRDFFAAFMVQHASAIFITRRIPRARDHMGSPRSPRLRGRCCLANATWTQLELSSFASGLGMREEMIRNDKKWIQNGYKCKISPCNVL